MIDFVWHIEMCYYLIDMIMKILSLANISNYYGAITFSLHYATYMTCRRSSRISCNIFYMDKHSLETLHLRYVTLADPNNLDQSVWVEGID